MIRIFEGDCRQTLPQIPSNSVHMALSSPPYWRLRDYKTGRWVGGDPECTHVVAEMRYGTGFATSPANTRGGAKKVGKVKPLQAAHDCPRCGAHRIDQQIGQEDSPEAFIDELCWVFREVHRILRPDGVLFLNIGDTSASSGGNGRGENNIRVGRAHAQRKYRTGLPAGWKKNEVIGIPWMLAKALSSGFARCTGCDLELVASRWPVWNGHRFCPDCAAAGRDASITQTHKGWYLRQEIIWCLSGGATVYARTAKGDGIAMIKDLARLDPATVQLWNGERWTRLLGMSRSSRLGDELELVLRSGERISCTPTHKFPTSRGLLAAADIKPGDVLRTCTLPEPDAPKDCALDVDAAWFAGLYLAEGSKNGHTIQISGHAKEGERWERVKRIAAKFGGSCTRTVAGNKGDIRVYGRVLHAIVDELVAGRTAHDKSFAPPVWRYSNAFVSAMLDGYLSGDGHWDEPNRRWRLGFCRNYALERDIRTACARLGYCLTLKLATAKFQNGVRPSFKGEIRMERSGHRNQRQTAEVVEVRKARCREVWDLGVADDPHLFALSSGVLTHNSKPNCMPESAANRCTKAHEQIFLLAKTVKPVRWVHEDGRCVTSLPEPDFYWTDKTGVIVSDVPVKEPGWRRVNRWAGHSYHYDALAIAEPASENTHARVAQNVEAQAGSTRANGGTRPDRPMKAMQGRVKGNTDFYDATSGVVALRNKRSVWTIPTVSFPGEHFAVFPPELAETCILAGTSQKGCCPVCWAPWQRFVGKAPENFSGDADALREEVSWWGPSCGCEHEAPVPSIVLDPFGGAGTTAMVADRLGRNAILCELSPEFTQIAVDRIRSDAGLFAEIRVVPTADPPAAAELSTDSPCADA